MMTNKKTHLLCGLALIVCCIFLLAVGCVNLSQLSQPGLETSYYTLEVQPPEITFASTKQIVRVMPFTSSPLFDSKAIVYRVKPYQTAEYLYHRWHMTPAEMTSRVLTLALDTGNLFAAVIGPDEPGRTHYTVAGHVETFLEDNTVSPWQAELALVVTLTDQNTAEPGERLLMRKKYSAVEICAKKHPRHLAEAMSRALETILPEIMDDIHQVVTNLERP